MPELNPGIGCPTVVRCSRAHNCEKREAISHTHFSEISVYVFVVRDFETGGTIARCISTWPA